MIWEMLGIAVLTLFLAFWLLVMFVIFRLAISAEPSGAGKVGYILVVIAMNLALILVFLGPVYDLAAISGSGSIAFPPQVDTAVYVLRPVVAILALLLLIPGGWMRIRSLSRESRERNN